MKLTVCLLLAGSLLTAARGVSAGDPAASAAGWAALPPSAAPAAIGLRLAGLFAARPFEFETNPRREVVIYPEALAGAAALQVACLAGDTNLQARLIQKFAVLLAPAGTPRISARDHVDFRVFGVVPLEIYQADGDPRCLTLGREFADRQWAATTADGLTTEARYWIDDTYMITALQVAAYRATGRAVCLDRAALTLSLYLDRLQQPNGLFFHGADAPFYWGRGNGWMAAGLAELLSALPAGQPRRARVLAGYQKMMAALLACQGADGLWPQLLDQPDAWPETSGSAMFDYALVTGVKQGWLDAARYGPAARRAWLALVRELDAQGNLREVCVGTDKGASRAFYLQRPRETGNLHGQAPMLWTAAAWLRSPPGAQPAGTGGAGG